MCGVGGAMDFRTMQNKLRRGRKCGSGRGGGSWVGYNAVDPLLKHVQMFR